VHERILFNPQLRNLYFYVDIVQLKAVISLVPLYFSMVSSVAIVFTSPN